MLKALIEKLSLTGSGKSSPSTSHITPDISRVIKMPPAQSQTPQSIAPNTPSINPEDLEARAETAVEDLSPQFDAWMEADLDRLKAAWQTAKVGTASEADYKLLETCAHNIRGVAKSYGYPAISRLCGSLCNLLADTQPGANGALINLHVEACVAAYSTVGRGEAAQSVANAVCDALEERVAIKTSQPE